MLGEGVRTHRRGVRNGRDSYRLRSDYVVNQLDETPVARFVSPPSMPIRLVILGLVSVFSALILLLISFYDPVDLSDINAGVSTGSVSTVEVELPAAAGPDSFDVVNAPQRSADFQRDDFRGAKAAVTYFFDTLDYARKTGNLILFDSVIAPNCQLCKDFCAQIKQLHSHKNLVQAATNTNYKMTASAHGVGAYTFDVTYTSGAVKVTNQAGDLVSSEPAISRRAKLEVRLSTDKSHFEIASGLIS